jgi:hypothetical protein
VKSPKSARKLRRSRDFICALHGVMAERTVSMGRVKVWPRT